VDTPMFRESQLDRSIEERAKVGSFQNNLIKRCAEPKELAAAICFLSSDSAGFITGITLSVDGGRSLH